MVQIITIRKDELCSGKLYREEDGNRCLLGHYLFQTNRSHNRTDGKNAVYFHELPLFTYEELYKKAKSNDVELIDIWSKGDQAIKFDQPELLEIAIRNLEKAFNIEVKLV